MEPESTADYSRQAYWDARYQREPSYDWFETAYPHCLKIVIDAVRSKMLRAAASAAGTAEEGRPSSAPVVVRVLHLGTGNSRLVRDLAEAVGASAASSSFAAEGKGEGEEGNRPEAGVRLHQVALDYSPVVIRNMAAASADLADVVEWVEGDIRDLAAVPQCCPSAPKFDIVIDKGTMDALQADKDNDDIDEDLDRMLTGVSNVLEKDRFGGGVFLQFTWEIPYYRFHWTKRDKYGWVNDAISAERLPDSDMYYVYKYCVASSAPSSDIAAAA